MKKNGFTLLELLVVIGIIGILVALATVSYTATQAAGRDSRRKQDMVAIQNAFEQYYSDDHVISGVSRTFVYPTNCVGGDADLADIFKSSWPEDPEGGAYTASTCTQDEYCFCATLEKADSGNSGSGCNWSAEKANRDYYCVGNLQ